MERGNSEFCSLRCGYYAGTKRWMRRDTDGRARGGGIRSGEAARGDDGDARRPQGRRSPGGDQGHRHLPYRRVHAFRRRPGRPVSRALVPQDRGKQAFRVGAGAGVTSVKKGDHVIPLYTPECRQCPSCLSRKTNLCTAIRGTQGEGVMPDGTSRFSIEGKPIHHYMGCSTFANFTVLPEIAVAKIREDAPFDKVCYVGCGVTTGVGAVLNTAKVEPGAKCVVFGLGGIGLNVIQGCRLAGADMIIGV